MGEKQAIRCDDCKMLYYISKDHGGTCSECGSDNIVKLTDEEAMVLFKQAMNS